jgi:hypothetical protein
MSKANIIRRYDIFKNSENSEEIDTSISLPLANLAVGDTSHDIDDKDKGISGITNTLDKPTSMESKMYKNGIPVDYNFIPSEAKAISSVIKENVWKIDSSETPVNGDYVPLNMVKHIKANKWNDGTQHKIKTINDNSYTVTYFDVKPEVGGKKGDLINAQTFFTNMGYNPSADTKNIAFVVDCTSIKIEDILNNGAPLSPNFKVYLMKAPEVENDPGGKTNLQSKTFQTYQDNSSNNRGVRYRAAVPHNLKKGDSYTYSYDPGNARGNLTTPYNQFFTNYTFNLSELQFEDKYIFSSLHTKLTISDMSDTVRVNPPPKTILNSGYANEITQVSNVIRNVLAKINKYGNKATKEDEFDFNCPIQQKRSGDWLQALLCCLIASKLRKFCEYNSPNFSISNIFKKKDIASGSENEPELNFEPQDVYLVTHDRILLAFALILGINVIFTHHYKEGGKSHSYHSAMVYKIENPLEQSQSKINTMINFYNEIKDTNNGFIPRLNIINGNLNGFYTKFSEALATFKDALNQKLREKTVILNTVGNNGKQLSASEIEIMTQEIFSLAFKINLIKTTFSNLDIIPTIRNDINAFLDNITGIKDNIVGTMENAIFPPEATNMNNSTEAYYIKYKPNKRYSDGNPYISYDEIVKNMTEYKKYEDIRNSYNPNIVDNITGFTNNLDKQLKKNPAFGLITAWRTCNAPKYNLWVEYNNVINMNSAYINDKNIFLYNLTNLDDVLKDNICVFYYNLFEKIKIPGNISGTASLQAKTQQNVLSFCLEVFINFGPNVVSDGNSGNIKAALSDFLNSPGRTSPVTNSNRDDSRNPLVYKPERFDNNTVIGELNALNSTEQISEQTINVIKIENAIYEPVVATSIIEEIEGVTEIKNNGMNKFDELAVSQARADSSQTPAAEANSGTVNLELSPPEMESIILQIPEDKPLSFGEIDVFDKKDKLVRRSPRIASQNKGGVIDMSGGVKAKKTKNMTFSFYNNIAPRIISASNLFRNMVSITQQQINDANERLIEMVNILSGPERQVVRNEEESQDQSRMNIDQTLAQMSTTPVTVEIVKDDSGRNRLLIYIGGAVIGIVTLAFTLAPYIAPFLYGKNNNYDDSESQLGGANKPIVMDGEWKITIVNDTNITLCNLDGKCYNVLLTEGEIDKINNFLKSESTRDTPLSQKSEMIPKITPKMIPDINNMISTEVSIFKNESYAPHPLLAIYLILESYCQEIAVTHIEESWDYENFIQFFVLINKMINHVLKIYSHEKNTNKNKLRAIMVGYGLRELIFTSPQYIERDPICMDSLNLGLSEYNQLSKMFGILVNRVCGVVNQTPEDIEMGDKYINNPIFKEYANEIPFQKICVADVDNVNTYDLALKANELFLKVGEKIISDTNGIENDTLLELTSVELPYLITSEEVSVAEPVARGVSNAFEIAKQEREKGRAAKLEQDSREQREKMAAIFGKKQGPFTGFVSPVAATIPLSTASSVYGGKTKKLKYQKRSKITRRVNAKKYKNKTRKNKIPKRTVNKTKSK